MKMPSDNSPDPRDENRYYVHETAIRRMLMAILTPLTRMMMKIANQGEEHIPQKGTVIVACNHLTNFDILPLQLSISRPLFFMAKEELHRNPVMDYFLRKGGAFPVYRGQKDPWAIRHAENVLEHGRVLALFPEGTRSKGRGLRPAKTGAARFALKMSCPILPVAVEGTERIFADFPRRTQIHVRIGETITPKPGEGPLALTDRLMYAIAAMLPKSLQGVYAEKPPAFRI